MDKCEHEDFVANVDVNRISDGKGGPLTNLYADIRVKCAICDESMRFIGVPLGLSPRHPTIEVGGLELRCPIQPESEDPTWGTGGPGFEVEINRATTN